MPFYPANLLTTERNKILSVPVSVDMTSNDKKCKLIAERLLLRNLSRTTRKLIYYVTDVDYEKSNIKVYFSLDRNKMKT
jgi:hypothetical protein